MVAGEVMSVTGHQLGLVLCAGELHFNLLGMILQCSSLATESFRLALIQVSQWAVLSQEHSASDAQVSSAAILPAVQCTQP
jgi:hypothetical protein